MEQDFVKYLYNLSREELIMVALRLHEQLQESTDANTDNMYRLLSTGAVKPAV